MEEYVDNEVVRIQMRIVVFFERAINTLQFLFRYSRDSEVMLLCGLECKYWKEKLVLPRVKGQCTGLEEITQ